MKFTLIQCPGRPTEVAVYPTPGSELDSLTLSVVFGGQDGTSELVAPLQPDEVRELVGALTTWLTERQE